MCEHDHHGDKPMSKKLKSLGQVAYEHYADSHGWQDRGATMTAWDCLTDLEKTRWENLAQSVCLTQALRDPKA